MTGPLEGTRVIEVATWMFVPAAGSVLADWGAAVIKVERPGTGDDTRAFPPFVSGESAYFATLNAGKQSIALDLKSTADRAVFDRLLARADVVLENYRPGVMDRLGYGFDALHKTHPRLVYGAVSGFGHTGPEAGKPAYDMVVQARGGVMSITGEEGGMPTKMGVPIADMTAGMFAAFAIVNALLHRERTGEGQYIDNSMHGSQVALLTYYAVGYFAPAQRTAVASRRLHADIRPTHPSR